MPWCSSRSVRTSAKRAMFCIPNANVPPLPRDLDRRPRAVRELHRPDERVHPVGERPLAVVEEHPGVPGPERHHLGLQTREIRRRPADVREDVLVELPAEASEASDQATARDHRELRHAGGRGHLIACVHQTRRHAGQRRGQRDDDESVRPRAPSQIATRAIATRSTASPDARDNTHISSHNPIVRTSANTAITRSEFESRRVQQFMCRDQRSCGGSTTLSASRVDRS